MKIPSSLISFTPNQKSARTTEQKQISDHYHRYANKNPHSHTNTHTVQCYVHSLGAENNARSSTKWYLATVGNALQSNLAAFSTDNPDGKDQLNRNRVALRYIFRLVFFLCVHFGSTCSVLLPFCSEVARFCICLRSIVC